MPARSFSLYRSFYVAFRGIFYTIYSQRNMKIHLFFSSIIVGGGWYFQVSQVEWLFLVYAIFSVLIAETLNTAVEINVDLVTKKKRIRAMMSKDVAAGAVLLAAIQSVVIGSVIFYERLLNCLGKLV